MLGFNYNIMENQNDFWDQLTFAQQEEIKQGLEEIKKGKFTDYETIMKKHR